VLLVADQDNIVPVATPLTGHSVNRLAQQFRTLDRQVATHRHIVALPDTPSDLQVEPCQVAA